MTREELGMLLEGIWQEGWREGSGYMVDVSSGREGGDALIAEALAAWDAAYNAGVEDAARVCDDECPATQDMTSTDICAALERAATEIRALRKGS